MREILFRGKKKNGNRWYEGDFIQDRYVNTNEPVYSILFFDLNDKPIQVNVDPETVGQYMGLKDKSGVKIFEGDIVHVLGNQQVEDWKCVDYIGLVAFLDAGFCVIDGTIDDHGFRRYGLHRLDFDLEVIGNIHDNPELLKEGGEK